MLTASLFTLLGFSVCADGILNTLQAERSLLHPRLCLAHPCPHGARWHRRDGLLSRAPGTEAQQFKHDLPLLPSVGRGNLSASLGAAFFSQSQCVGVYHQCKASILILFNCVWPLNLSTEMFIMSGTHNFQNYYRMSCKSSPWRESL